MSSSFPLAAYLADRRGRIDAALVQALAGPDSPVDTAMRYSVLAGGKRLRPILVLAAAEAVGDSEAAALPVAVAFELVHTQSLMVDDLPCMDDDGERRGRPTAHVVYGEATTLLAGNSLMALAYSWIAGAPVPAERRLLAVNELASAVQAMCRGQMLDLATDGAAATPERLQEQHRLKTASLIRGALRAGAAVAGADEGAVEQLGAYGADLGLAFQITDDLLDEDDPPSRSRSAKLTYPGLFGRERSQQLAREAGERALVRLAGWGDEVAPLRALVDFVLTRRQ